MNSGPRSFLLLPLLCLLAGGRGVLAEVPVVLPAAPCESLSADCGYNATLRQLNQLKHERLHVFVAEPPYSVLVNGRQETISLGGHPRRFDFGGQRPFVNPATGVPDVATFNAWNVGKDGRPTSTLSGAQIGNAGIPGRIFKERGRTVLAYVAGDPPVAGKCRSQLSSYPVPARRRFLFDLSFQLGEDAAGRHWHLTKPGVRPAGQWQLKAPNVTPALGIVADAYPDDAGRLRLSFIRKGGNCPNPSSVGSQLSFAPYQPLRLLVDVFLDERKVADGGRG